MARGKAVEIELSDGERSELEAMVRRRITLKAAEGMNNSAITEVLEISRRTAGKWRTRFAALDVASGKIIGKFYKRQRMKEFVRFLREVEKQFPTISTCTWSWTITARIKRSKLHDIKSEFLAGPLIF
jgi:transposase